MYGCVCEGDGEEDQVGGVGYQDGCFGDIYVDFVMNVL